MADTDLQRPGIPVDGPLLACLSEATRGTLSLTARGGGEIVGALMQDIGVLAFSERGGTAGIPAILAAFVQPNHPAVALMIQVASDLMRASGKADSFEGYQGSSKTRVREQAHDDLERGPGVDPAAWALFREPAMGQAVDPAEMPLPELVVLARRCMSPGMTEEVVLAAMRDARGLRRLRESARNRCLAALLAARG